MSKFVKLWQDADVIVCRRLDNNVQAWLDEQTSLGGFQKVEPRRRAVVTNYAQEVSWLFMQIKDIFDHEVDHISEYDLFGFLADAVSAHLDAHQNNVELKQLLDSAVEKAKSFLNL